MADAAGEVRYYSYVAHRPRTDGTVRDEVRQKKYVAKYAKRGHPKKELPIAEIRQRLYAGETKGAICAAYGVSYKTLCKRLADG